MTQNQTPAEAFYALLRPGLKHPAHFVIEDDDRHGVHALSLFAHPEDKGKLIGKRGATITALNELADAYSRGTGNAVRLIIPDSIQGEEPVRNLRYQAPTVSFQEWALVGIQAILSGAAPECHASFVPRRFEGYTLVVAPAMPVELAEPLDRWLAVLANAGAVKLMMDAAAAR